VNEIKSQQGPKQNLKKTASTFRFLAIAVGLISFSVLSFEIIFTRIFSVMLSHDYVFAILSFALFGLGLGGIFYHNRYQKYLKNRLGEVALLFSLLIILSVIAIIKLPIYNSPKLIDVRLWIYIFLATINFVAAGVILSAVFQKFPTRSSILYGVDLIGAALGVGGAILLLNNFDAITAVFMIAGFSLLSAIFLFLFDRRFSAFNIIATVAVLLLIVTGFLSNSLKEVPIALDPDKDMYRMLNHPLEKAKIIESRWNAFGRTDLVKSEQEKDQMVLFVDGAAGSPMYNLDYLLEKKERTSKFLHHIGESFPFLFLTEDQKDSALVIGPGGGRDVVIALLGGVKSITAVEVNPAMVEIVRKYEDYNGGIYTKIPNVKVIIQEGRNYLRNVDEKYDLIMLALPIIKSSRSIEGFALTENYLFTVEAFEDYMDHLTPEGRLVIVAHGDVEIYRLLVLFLEMNKRRGIPEAEAMKHVYTLAIPLMPTIVFQKQPFDSAAASARHEMLHKLRYDNGNYFVPMVDQIAMKAKAPSGIESEWLMFDQMMVDLSRGNLTYEQLVGAANFDISPVTDDRPFFYDFKKGLPTSLTSIFFFVIFGIGVILAPVFRSANSKRQSKFLFRNVLKLKQLRKIALMFFLLGTGYMTIEIAFFQKITLYFRHPVYALGVVLLSLLLGTGLGSFASSKIRKNLSRMIALWAIVVALLSIIYINYLVNLFTGINNPIIATFILTLPLGFFMGFPFPLTIRLMKEQKLERYIAWMWGVNGMASVLGSTLTIMVGMTFGFTIAIYWGAILYLFISILALFIAKKAKVQQTTQAVVEG